MATTSRKLEKKTTTPPQGDILDAITSKVLKVLLNINKNITNVNDIKLIYYFEIMFYDESNNIYLV